MTSINGTLTVNPAALTVTGTMRAACTAMQPGFHGHDHRDQEWRQHHGDICQRSDRGQRGGGYPIVPTLVDPTAKLANYS